MSAKSSCEAEFFKFAAGAAGGGVGVAATKFVGRAATAKLSAAKAKGIEVIQGDNAATGAERHFNQKKFLSVPVVMRCE